MIVSRINQSGERPGMNCKRTLPLNSATSPHAEACIYGARTPSCRNVPAEDTCHAKFSLVLCQCADVLFSQAPLDAPQFFFGVAGTVLHSGRSVGDVCGFIVGQHLRMPLVFHLPCYTVLHCLSTARFLFFPK